MMKAVTRGLVAALVAISGAGPLMAQTSAEVTAHYDFYVGGFHIAEVSLDATAEGNSYRDRPSAVTRGMLDVILRGRSASEAQGRLGRSGQIMPMDFSTLYSSRRGEQAIHIAYDDANPASVMFDPKADADANRIARSAIGGGRCAAAIAPHGIV